MHHKMVKSYFIFQFMRLKILFLLKWNFEKWKKKKMYMIFVECGVFLRWTAAFHMEKRHSTTHSTTEKRMDEEWTEKKSKIHSKISAPNTNLNGPKRNLLPCPSFSLALAFTNTHTLSLSLKYENNFRAENRDESPNWNKGVQLTFKRSRKKQISQTTEMCRCVFTFIFVLRD